MKHKINLKIVFLLATILASGIVAFGLIPTGGDYIQAIAFFISLFSVLGIVYEAVSAKFPLFKWVAITIVLLVFFIVWKFITLSISSA
jgi:hypothetical protein